MTDMTKTSNIQGQWLDFPVSEGSPVQIRLCGCIEKGFMMTKVFGFLVCLMATMGVSQAALLASYTFTGNKNATGVEVSLSADPFTGPGTASTTFYEHNNGSTTTSGGQTSNGTVQLTPNVSGYSFSYTRVVVKYRAKGDLGLNNKIFVGINDDQNGVEYKDPTGTSNNAAAISPANDFYTFDTTLTTPIIGDPDSPLSLSLFSFVTPGSTANSTNRRLQIDSIELFGDVVPEPASMAIFGLLGVGAAAGRFRRKK